MGKFAAESAQGMRQNWEMWKLLQGALEDSAGRYLDISVNRALAMQIIHCPEDLLQDSSDYRFLQALDK